MFLRGSCTSFLDSFDGAAEHIAQRVNLAVVAKAALSRILAHAAKRGWRLLRLLSSAGNTYNREYFGETAEGAQMPMLNVSRRVSGAIRHFWGSELLYAPTEPGQDSRHTDSIDSQWDLFDFTPVGRGTDWYPQLSYSPRVPPHADAAEPTGSALSYGGVVRRFRGERQGHA